MKFNTFDMDAKDVNGLRYYETPNKILYPSITTVLGNTLPPEKQEVLRKWKERVGEEEAERVRIESTEKGTQVHLMTERFLKNEDVFQKDGEFSKDAIKLFEKLKKILPKITEVVEQEIALYSDLIEIAGRCDCIGVVNNKLSIIDFKTSKRAKPDEYIYDYKLQLTAYAIMCNELFKTDIRDGYIFMTSEDMPQIFHVDLTKYVEPLVERRLLFTEKITNENKSTDNG